MKFTNNYIKLETNRLKKYVLYCVCSLIISFIGIIILTNVKTYKMTKEYSIDKNVYLDINSNPIFISNDISALNKRYYLVKDNDNFYIIKLYTNNESEINKQIKENKTYKLIGKTKLIPQTIIEELEKNKYSMDSNIYIDNTATIVKNEALFTICVVALLSSIPCLLLFLYMYLKYKKSIKNLTDSEVVLLDKQMNSEDSLYYKGAGICLTKNYIIKFINKIDYIKYSDVIWIYSKTYKNKGMTYAKSIFVYTKYGKKIEVARISKRTKQYNALFESIYERMINRCPKALNGNTKENKKKIKEKYRK